MKHFFRKVKDLQLDDLGSLTVLCSAMVVLMLVFVFLSNASLRSSGGFLSQEGLTPSSQTGCVVDCGSGGGSPTVSIYANSQTPASGEGTTISFTASGNSNDGSTLN